VLGQLSRLESEDLSGLRSPGSELTELMTSGDGPDESEPHYGHIATDRMTKGGEGEAKESSEIDGVPILSLPAGKVNSQREYHAMKGSPALPLSPHDDQKREFRQEAAYEHRLIDV
jgi:hypothetical protein